MMRIAPRSRTSAIAALCIAAIGLWAACASAAGDAAGHRSRLEVQALYARAQARLAEHRVEARRMAIADLERATMLDPDDTECQLLLARAYYQAGFLKQASRRFERLAALAPDDPEARFGLAQVWRRDWLKYLDRNSLARAIENLAAATRLEPRHTDAWLMLSSLEVEQHDSLGAQRAAIAACAAEPGRAEALLALASARWRLGDVAGADSAFAAALPKLRRSVRERFEDFAPLASERDTAIFNHLDAAAQVEFARRFWAEQDPDPTTSANEAQLEYRARVAQAYFLFYDAKHREWDERGEVYVRYGPPEAAVYNPLGAKLYSSVSQSSQMTYPANVLRWDYPRLGMTVLLQDRILSEYYQLPITFDHDPDPRPDPEALARLDVVQTHEGRGVFPALPPGVKPLTVHATVAAFEGAAGPRLFSALETAAAPGDTLWAEAVVVDTAQHEVARSGRSLSPSACTPERFRVADFASDLPPGRYTLGLAVRGGGRRGTSRIAVLLQAPDTSISLSDIVVTCGAPLITGAAVRLDADPLAQVGDGDALTAYFEISHLAAGAGGEARFEYVYAVKSAQKDPRIWIQRALQPRPQAPAISVSRDESQVGSVRRQFLSVPVQSLPPGRYKLEVTVRDLVSGQAASRTTPFSRVAGPRRAESGANRTEGPGERSR